MKLIENLFGSKTKIQILRKLSLQKNWDFSISELSRDLNIHKALVSRIVKKLEKDNIVKITQKGRTKLVKLNEKNMLVKTLVLEVFENEKNLQKKIEQTIKRMIDLKKLNIISVILYGSFVKGKFNISSDIDVMIVVKKDKTKTNKQTELISRRLAGKDIIVFFDVIEEQKFKKLYKQKEPLIVDIFKNHKILSGKEILEMI